MYDVTVSRDKAQQAIDNTLFAVGSGPERRDVKVLVRGTDEYRDALGDSYMLGYAAALADVLGNVYPVDEG